jgi:hypothetical protein
MIATAAEQMLVPSAARFHIGHGNQRLRTHSASLSIHTAAMANYFEPFLSTRRRYAHGTIARVQSPNV